MESELALGQVECGEDVHQHPPDVAHVGEALLLEDLVAGGAVEALQDLACAQCNAK